MIDEIGIENFRCFEEINLRPTKYNLVAGKNDVGKTALLEAFFMLAGAHNPQTALTLDMLRGVHGFEADIENMFRWMFKDGDTSSKVVVNASDGDYKRQLSAYIKEQEEIEISKTKISSPRKDSPEISGDRKAVTFEYRDSAGNEFEVTASIEGEDVNFQNTKRLYPKSVFISDNTNVGQEYVDRFSELQDRGKEGEVISALGLVDDRIKDVKIASTSNNPSLKVDMGKARLIPLEMMGGGVSKLAKIVINLSIIDNGLVLVDEIDQGIHYSILKDVWSLIEYISSEKDNQVVCTTHSLECIRAASEVLGESAPNQFVLHRLEREDGSVVAKRISSESLKSSLQHGFDVR